MDRLSATLLKRLRSGSRRNAPYTAFREVGKVILAVQLLRYLSDAPLHAGVTAASNKVEAFNGFSDWVRFGFFGTANSGLAVVARSPPANRGRNGLLARGPRRTSADYAPGGVGSVRGRNG